MTDTFSQSFIEYFPNFIIFFTLSYSSTKTKKTKQTTQQKSSLKWIFYISVGHILFFPTHQLIETSFSGLQFIYFSLSVLSSSILEFKGFHNQQYCSWIFNTASLHNKSVFRCQPIYMLPRVMNKHHNFFRADTPYLCGFVKMTLLFWTIMSSCKKN